MQGVQKVVVGVFADDPELSPLAWEVLVGRAEVVWPLVEFSRAVAGGLGWPVEVFVVVVEQVEVFEHLHGFVVGDEGLFGVFEVFEALGRLQVPAAGRDWRVEVGVLPREQNGLYDEWLAASQAREAHGNDLLIVS